ASLGCPNQRGDCRGPSVASLARFRQALHGLNLLTPFEDPSAMFLARVTGSVVATQKVASMTGHKLLTVEPYRVDDKGFDRLVPTGRTFVVVDTLGAGIDEMVLICQGSSARLTPETEKLPIDAVVIGLVDTVDVGGKVVFSTRAGGPSRT